MKRIFSRKHHFSVALLTAAVAVILTAPHWTSARGSYDLPKLPPPEEYGDVFIDRFANPKKIMPVVFSHWVHRPKYTCRVCHMELDFSMKSSDTPIVCGGGEMTGKFCTICHDNRTAFGPTGPDGEKNCDRCHNANASPNREKFDELKESLPAYEYGDKIDWVKAMRDGLIKPKHSLSKAFAPIAIDRTLTLRAEMGGISPSIFPHKTHEEWLDCVNCHPDIFNIKKKTTKNFTMARILNKEFCGVCHLRVAFPLNDCKRCHPGMKN